MNKKYTFGIAVLSIVLFFCLGWHAFYRYKSEQKISSLQEELQTANKEKETANLALQDPVADNEILQNQVKQLNLEDENPKIEATKTAYPINRQCYDLILGQFYGKGLLYSKELDLPIIRLVPKKSWNLIKDAAIVNFTHQQLNSIKVSSCTYKHIDTLLFYKYDDASLEERNSPPKDGWIKAKQNSKGEYIIPLTKCKKINGCKYIAIKHLVGNTPYYGTFVVEP